jgi:hypothetical protein
VSVLKFVVVMDSYFQTRVRLKTYW